MFTASFGYLIGLGVPQTAADAQAFENQYTNEGKCLHGTPYDVSLGAVAVSQTLQPSGETVVSILPIETTSPGADVSQNDILRLTYVGINSGSQELNFADAKTAIYLNKHGCPLPPSN